jgi:hypothetical protein
MKRQVQRPYSTVFLSTLIFSGLAVILSFWRPNVYEKMTNQVAATRIRMVLRFLLVSIWQKTTFSGSIVT